MLTLSLITTALALPADGGIQIAMYRPGATFVEQMIGDQSFDILKELVSSEAACYDEVGIRDLNVHIPLGDAEISFFQDALSVDLFFDQIHGEDMVIFGEDDDWFDVCPSFEIDFHSFQITDARVRLTMQPWIDGDAVMLEVLGEPIVSGTITTDIDWVPDTLILGFIEEKIWEVVSEKLAEAIPAMVSEAVDTSLYAGQLGDLGVDVELTDVSVGPFAMVVGMDLAAEWNGESCLVVNAPDEPEGRSPEFDYGSGNGSAIGLGLTERQLNGLLLSAWSDGLLCFEYGPLSGALDAVGDAISDPVDNAEIELEFGAPPVVRLDPDRLRLKLDQFHFALIGDIEGEPTEFIRLDANIEAAIELRVDPEISSIVLDLVYVDLQITDFQADALLSDQAGAQERLIAFIEGWVMEVVGSRIQQVPVYGSLFHAADIFIRLDTVEATNGGLLLQASLFDGDDPAVDTEPPNTEARIASATHEVLHLEWKGSDDKNEALLFSWRIDGAEWSDWTGGSGEQLAAPEIGAHIIEVRARDAWHNVDPSPALIAFEIPAPDKAEEGCMCTASAAKSSLLGWLMLPLLWVRRRR
jgi:hypothetical protein